MHNKRTETKSLFGTLKISNEFLGILVGIITSFIFILTQIKDLLKLGPETITNLKNSLLYTKNSIHFELQIN